MSLISYTNEQAWEILNSSSPNGFISMYAVSLSLDTKIAFDRVDLCKKLNVSSEYFYGYLVSCYSVNILKFNIKDYILTPIYFDPIIKRRLIEAIKLRSEKDEVLKGHMALVDKYFRVNEK